MPLTPCKTVQRPKPLSQHISVTDNTPPPTPNDRRTPRVLLPNKENELLTPPPTVQKRLKPSRYLTPPSPLRRTDLPLSPSPTPLLRATQTPSQPTTWSLDYDHLSPNLPPRLSPNPSLHPIPKPPRQIHPPPRPPRTPTPSELLANLRKTISNDPNAPPLHSPLAKTYRANLFLTEHQRHTSAQETALNSHSTYINRYTLALANPNSSRKTYTALLRSFSKWDDDDWTRLGWRVYFGLSDGCLSVPCIFWSCESAFHTAAGNLAKIRGCREGVYAATARLRTALREVGAFVGWLPLDCGIDAAVPSVPVHVVPLLTGSTDGMSGAARTALSWVQPVRQDPLAVVPSKPRQYKYEDYRILGPDAAFLLYDFDRRVICFDSGYLPTPPRVGEPASWVMSGRLRHRGEWFTLHSLGSVRGFGCGEKYPWEGVVHGMIVDAEAELSLARWMGRDVGQLAVEVRHWA